MTQMYVFGALICAVVYIKKKDLLEVKFDVISRFLAFMALVACYRLAVMSIFGDIISNHTSKLANIEFWRLTMVWWEDAAFAVPIYFVSESTKIHKILKVIIIVAISYLFGSGHAYQGSFAVFITALYPYFISTRYAKKHGFGTVMVCHILYDVITFVNVKVAPMILGCVVK